MTGRWPANVILSPEAAATIDEQSGDLKAGHFPATRNSDKFAHTYGDFEGLKTLEERHMDSGGASRYFLTAGYEPWELEWIIANGLTPCGT